MSVRTTRGGCAPEKSIPTRSPSLPGQMPSVRMLPCCLASWVELWLGVRWRGRLERPHGCDEKEVLSEAPCPHSFSDLLSLPFNLLSFPAVHRRHG